MKNLDLEKVMLEVRWRGGFADRNDIYPINTDIQINSLDDRVRIRIYNYFYEYFNAEINRADDREAVANLFLQEFYLTHYTYDGYYNGIKGTELFKNAIQDTIYKDHWSKVFSFIEFWADFYQVVEPNKFNAFKQKINNILEKEFVGYRLVNCLIAQITDENEIRAIEETSNLPYDEVKKHISKAIEKLSDRENPDYENSIKESISSVEAMTKIIVGNKNTTLNKALNQLANNGINIHPKLKSVFIDLYNYTSDDSGVRHSAKIGGVDSTFEEAKFMLVACSAFNNYLLSNSK